MATVKALHIAIGARVEGFQRGMTKAQRSLRNFEKSTRRARGMVVGATGAMARGFAVMGTAATVAIADSIRVFASFESSMLRVKAITGATGKEFQGLTDLAKELGASTAFTARESADAMGFLAQAGFSVGEITKTLPRVLSLAAAGQLDLASAADITASVLRGFGMQATESARVADVLAASASKSNTSVGEMGEAFKFAGPVASAMGVSIEETAAALGVLSNAGLKGSLAGTGLRMVLVKMGEDISKAGGLLPALQQLDTDGVQAVVQTMKDLDARAGTAAVALTKQLGTVRSLRDEFELAAGSSDKMAEIMLSGLAGSAIESASAFEGLRIQIGQTFEKFGTGFFQEITDILRAITEHVKDFENSLKGLEKTGTSVAQGVLFAFEMLISAIAFPIDVITGSIKLLAAGIMKLDNLARGIKGGFGAKGFLDDTDREMIKEFTKPGTSLVDDISNFFANIDAALAPTAKATNPKSSPGTGVAGFNAAMNFFKPKTSSATDKPDFSLIGEQIAKSINEFSPLGFGTDAPKAAADRPGGFTEGIQTALGMVKVDPTVAKKDSDNLDKIAKNTENMFREMLTGLESFS